MIARPTTAEYRRRRYLSVVTVSHPHAVHETCVCVCSRTCHERLFFRSELWGHSLAGPIFPPYLGFLKYRCAYKYKYIEACQIFRRAIHHRTRLLASRAKRSRKTSPTPLREPCMLCSLRERRGQGGFSSEGNNTIKESTNSTSSDRRRSLFKFCNRHVFNIFVNKITIKTETHTNDQQLIY